MVLLRRSGDTRLANQGFGTRAADP